MDTRLTYIFVDIGCLLFPLLFSFHPKFAFYKQWRYFALPALATGTFFVVWDILFTRMGVWGFNDHYVLGVYIARLPVEELLFFLCIPYACVFTYFCTRNFVTRQQGGASKLLTVFLIGFCLCCGVIFYDRLYTSVTALLLAIVLSVLLFSRVTFLRNFYIAYALVIPFFLLSNGILTGSFIAEPVVWYNNTQNTGLRLFTIPFEDVFYGMLLVLLNVAGYEYLLSRNKQRT